MAILITGAQGQLGRALRAALADSKWKRDVLQSPSAITFPLGPDRVAAYGKSELDITRLDAVRAAIDQLRPRIVINAAAFTRVDEAEAAPEPAYRVNALGPRNLAVASAERTIPLLHVSTDYVFDGRAERPYHEFDPTHPLSVYGLSKLAGEEAVRSLNPRHYIVRTAWLYHTLGRNFVTTMRELADRPRVQVVSDQHGSPTYAPHLAQALLRLIDSRAYGTYHIAGAGGTSRFELTRTLYRLLGLSTPVTPVAASAFPRPAPRPRYAVLTSRQDPAFVLPAWQDGLSAFVRASRQQGAD